MWNGFWKLTAMVGVIGVGLFAVYQAQKGIRPPLMNINSDAETADTTDPAPSPDVEEALPEARREEALPTVVGLFDEQAETSVAKFSRQKPDGSSVLTDNRSDRGTKRIATAKALTKGKQVAKIVPVKQTSLDFSDDPEPAVETNSTDTNDEPTELPQDDSAESSMDDKSDATSTSDPAADSESDPFSDDASPGKTQVESPSESDAEAETPESEPASEPTVVETPVEAKEEPVKEEPVKEEPVSENPGKTKISSEFDSDPPPPRSNRAKHKKGEKPRDTPAAESPDPFADEPPAGRPPLKKPKAEAVPQEESPLELPPPSDEQEKPKFKLDEPAAPTHNSKSPPATLRLPDDDRPLPTDSLRVKSKSVPAQLPAVLPDVGFDDAPPAKKREPAPRRTNYDAVTQTDMIGDGDIGDPSQRGVQQPRLTIEKIAQQQAVLGQPLIYSIIVKNIGNVDAHNVVVEDRIPKGTELKGTSPQAELSGKRLIWNHPLLRPNEEKKISIKVVPHQEGPIGSVARVYFATEVSTEIVVAAPQLEFTIKSPREVRMGQRFDMVFLLKNVGKVDATNIVVRDIVPDSLKTEAGNDIECPVGKLSPNESREVVLTVTATKTGTVLNQTVLTADSGVRKSYENEIDVNGEVLVLTRSGKNQLYVEHAVVFTNNVRNEGNQRADRVKISEVVPAGMQFETASDGGKFDPQSRAVVWTLGPLAPGSDRSVTVKYVPKETGTLESNITATGNLGSTATVSASVKVIGKPVLQMETLSATGSVTVGERMTSRFQLNNSGTAPANNVQLRIRLPGELRLISARGGKYRQDGDEVIFEPISELLPSSKASYELLLEPTAEADAQIGLEIAAEHLSKPAQRIETIQIAHDALK